MDKKVLSVIQKVEAFGEKRLMFNIPREAGEHLQTLLTIYKPTKILEVGTSNGYSTLWLAGSCPQSSIITIELKKNKVEMAEENFKKAGLTHIRILQGDALEILPKLTESFDFVFLDAVKKDYLSYFKCISFHKNAIVVADNIITHSEQLKNYVDYVRKNYTSELVEVGNGMEITFL